MHKVSLSFVALVVVSAICAGGCTLGPDSDTASLKDLKPQESSFPTKLAASLGASSSPSTLGPEEPLHEGVSLGSKATPSAELHVATARMAEQSGQLAEAERHYQEALAIDPRHTQALVGQARLKDNNGQPDRALALYETAAKADPDNASIFNAMGLSYARQRRFRQSIGALERAIRLEPKKGLYRNNVAMVLVETGDIDGALSHLKAVQGEAVAHYNVGYILQKKGDSAAAAEHFAQAAEKDPSLTAASAWLAKLQAERPRTSLPTPQIASAKRSHAPPKRTPHTPTPLTRKPRTTTPSPTPITRTPLTTTPAPTPLTRTPPAPPLEASAPAPLPPVIKPPSVALEGPNLKSPKPVVQKLPPVPQPLEMQAPPEPGLVPPQPGLAPLPPSSRIGQPVPDERSEVRPLPPVVTASDLP